MPLFARRFLTGFLGLILVLAVVLPAGGVPDRPHRMLGASRQTT